MQPSRRGFITGLVSFVACAPAIVKAASLIPVKSMPGFWLDAVPWFYRTDSPSRYSCLTLTHTGGFPYQTKTEYLHFVQAQVQELLENHLVPDRHKSGIMAQTPFAS